jgi:hypothetical protein
MLCLLLLIRLNKRLNHGQSISKTFALTGVGFTYLHENTVSCHHCLLYTFLFHVSNDQHEYKQLSSLQFYLGLLLKLPVAHIICTMYNDDIFCRSYVGLFYACILLYFLLYPEFLGTTIFLVAIVIFYTLPKTKGFLREYSKSKSVNKTPPVFL